MPDAAQSDSETLDGGIIRAVKLPGQNLPGDVEPRNAISCESGGLAVQESQDYPFMLAQRVGKLRFGFRHFRACPLGKQNTGTTRAIIGFFRPLNVEHGFRLFHFGNSRIINVFYACSNVPL